jgi:hypothetical protein
VGKVTVSIRDIGATPVPIPDYPTSFPEAGFSCAPTLCVSAHAEMLDVLRERRTFRSRAYPSRPVPTWIERRGDNSEDVVPGENPFDSRLQLYYLQGDLEKTIMGVELHSFYNEASTGLIPGTPQVFSVELENDGTLTLNDYQAKPIFSGFHRLPNVDDQGTAVFKANDSDLPVSYRLVSDRGVED